MEIEHFNNVWAIVKDGVVLNSIVFEGESPMFMDRLKSDFGADEIVHCKGHTVVPDPGYTWDGTKFIPPTEE